MATIPHFMISSTLFDLKQVRADLARFIVDELGSSVLASEWPSFPVDPDVDTIENCRRRVEREADVLVLLIGGRYGSVDSRSAKSVTNLEYLTARAKGIPIYAFIERRVMALLPIWKANKSGDFSSVVDDTRVFAFIDEVRVTDKVWTHDFDLAQEIVAALRSQCAYLLLRGVEMVRRVRSDREYVVLRTLQGPPLRIALERSRAWEYRLFGELLVQEVDARKTLCEQKRLSISHGAYEWVKTADFESWLHPRMAEAKNIMHALNAMEPEYSRATGPLGQSGDLELIVSTARSIGSIYQEALEWLLRVRRIAGDTPVRRVATAMDHAVDDILANIETLGPRLLAGVAEAEAAIERGEPPPPFAIHITIGVPRADEITAAIDALAGSVIASRRR
jgi:hypothetical protein